MDNSAEVPQSDRPLITLSWIDYTLFVIMFGLSALIGIYYGCSGKKQTTTDYLFGGKRMNIFPISMSLIASHLSGITLLGIPAEVYMHGSQYMACNISAIISCVVIIYFYLPVFYNLQVTSSYEYLKLRFDKRIQMIASFIYTTLIFLYMPVVIFVPALVFNQVTGINLHYITPAVCIVCIFYTTLGGLKAVVWTDTLQFSAAIAAMGTVFFLGTKSAGGLANIWEIANQKGRIEFFNMDPDPTTRNTFWGISIGLTTIWISYLAVEPSCVQRYLSLPTFKAAVISVVIMGIGLIITKCLCGFFGIIMFAKYANCDPMLSGKIQHPDQLLPYFILDVAGTIPGLSGVFISGIFSASLSTLSTFFNTLSATLYEDFIKAHMPPTMTETKGQYVMKSIVVILGTICVMLVFVVEKLGGVVQIATTFSGITSGPLLALFTLGMFLPFVNTKGALCGGLVSILVMTWILVGSQLSIAKGLVKIIPKPRSTEGCGEAFLNSTLVQNLKYRTLEANEEDIEVFWLYRVSFYWYSVIGFVVCAVVGLLVSWFTNDGSETPTDPNLFSPFVQKYIRTPKLYKNEYRTVYQPCDIIAMNSAKGTEAEEFVQKL